MDVAYELDVLYAVCEVNVAYKMKVEKKINSVCFVIV